MGKFGVVLRQALGMSTSKDARAIHARGEGPYTPAGLRWRVAAVRCALGATLIVPTTAYLVFPASHAWEGSLFAMIYLFPGWDWPRERVLSRAAGDGPAKAIAQASKDLSTLHDRHSESLKYFLGDPSSLFYQGGEPGLTVSAALNLDAKRRTAQEIHDYWHTEYSDDIYRRVFKAALPETLLRRYVGHLVRGEGFVLLDTWVRNLPPEALWDVSNEIERGWRGPQDPAWRDLHGDEQVSDFRMDGEPDRGQARPAPTISETNPEE